MSREPEFITKHLDALRVAEECCETLKMNAVEPAPRGAVYAKLVQANKELEGTCRQMFHWRGDDARWLRLGSLYAKALKVMARLYLGERWEEFGDLAYIYRIGFRRLMNLAERPTGRGIEKFILPGDISPWFEPKRIIH